MVKNAARIGLISLFVAWAFDQLFWEKNPGISFLIYVLLCLAAGAFLTWQERQKPAAGALILLLPVVFFAGMSALRLEPLTLLMDYGLALLVMVVLSLTWLGGRWWRYSVPDALYNFFRFVGWVVGKPGPVVGPAVQGLLLNKSTSVQAVEGVNSAAAEGGQKTRPASRPVVSIAFGLLLALPLVWLLGALLSQADPVFAKRMTDVLEFLNIDNLGEYIFRLTYILIGTYLLAGIFIFALVASKAERVSEGEKSWVPAFLDWVVSATVLVCVNLLFAFFVVIQFQYFFGGEANISYEGYTYAEYVHRGFGELLVVAFISLLLLLGLSLVTRSRAGMSKWIFSGLGILLVALVGVMLVSAFQRLQLYETAYGFTRLRTYTHVFMVWLGVLLALTVILEIFGRMRFFALACLFVGVGFAVTMNLLNVDAFIANQNLNYPIEIDNGDGTKRAALDVTYLQSLTDDAVPVLVTAFRSGNLLEQKDQIGVLLACRAAELREESGKQAWPSFHWSHYRAQTALEENAGALLAYPVWRENGVWMFRAAGDAQRCHSYQGMD